MIHSRRRAVNTGRASLHWKSTPFELTAKPPPRMFTVADRDTWAGCGDDPIRGCAPKGETHTGIINLYAAWVGILLGFIAGAVHGLFFHDDMWLGGYGTWRRRMARLGHISLFGIAFINFAYALTVRSLGLHDTSLWPSRLFIVGAVTMPLVCYLSAYRKPFRHLFFVPVFSLIVGAIIFLFGEVRP
jgi:hypothetical protein